MKDVQFHEAANIFPLMTGDDYDRLVADIRANGLMETIKLLDGQVIDGRNRYRACLEAGVKHRFEEIEADDPIAFVLSLNLHRRHLTPSQQSMIAGRAKEQYAKQAKERMKAGGGDHKSGRANLPPPVEDAGKARDKAAKAVGVSGRSVDYACKVLENGTPELVKAVDEGRMAVSTAAILSSEPPEVQDQEATKPHRNRRYTPGPNGTGKPEGKEEESHEPTPEQRTKSKAIRFANEAVDALRRIPKNDPLRKRGFQIVTDWIRANK